MAPVFLHRSLPYKLICQYSTISFHQLTFTNSFTILQLCIILLVVENIPKMSILDYLITHTLLFHHLTFIILQHLSNCQYSITTHSIFLCLGKWEKSLVAPDTMLSHCCFSFECPFIKCKAIYIIFIDIK